LVFVYGFCGGESVSICVDEVVLDGEHLGKVGSAGISKKEKGEAGGRRLDDGGFVDGGAGFLRVCCGDAVPVAEGGSADLTGVGCPRGVGDR
jgi:hypothetical protein